VTDESEMETVSTILKPQIPDAVELKSASLATSS